MDRRQFLQACAAAGIASPLFPGAVLALAQTSTQSSAAYPRDSFPKITDAMLEQAAEIAGLTLTPEQRKQVLEAVSGQRDSIQQIRALRMPNSVAPSMVFDPRPKGFVMPRISESTPTIEMAEPDLRGLIGHEDKLAFASIAQLHHLLRTKKITSVELTKLYLARLKRFNAQLHFVVTLTEERAMKQAAQADHEIAAGRMRGPLHGIPWGAKDLLSVAGYPTTWGARGFEQQHFDTDATVVKRLDKAGAVLIAKLTLGALAQGDIWFEGFEHRTRNPWNPKQGSSGSSAGSASAVSAGCVGFAIGSETLGSISSPSTRCGVTGLRPTFGLVPRTGAMALSWSMDKLGPIGRCVSDCVTVLRVIAGPDGIDHAVRDDAKPGYAVPFAQNNQTLRVGYVPGSFEEAGIRPLKPKPAESDEAATKAWLAEKNSAEMRRYDLKYDRAALDVLRAMGVQLVPITLPELPWSAMTYVLEAEGAAAFDELTRSGADAQLNEQHDGDWPNVFRTSRFYSAVDYIQAMRARSLGIEAMAKVMEQVDVIVTPSNGMQLRVTNLTGHPAVILPNGVRGDDAPLPLQTGYAEPQNVGGPGTPLSITLIGQLYDDARLASIAGEYQARTQFHLAHPPLFSK